MSALLEIEGVSRRFGGLVAVNDCSLRVEAGGITGLIGPNGAGKSTLFDIVSGLIRPDRGSIRLKGAEIAGLPAHRIARLGLRRTFQIPRELGRLSVIENLMVVPAGQRGDRFGALLGTGRAVAREEEAVAARARAVLEEVGLAGKAEDAAAQLSGGQKKLLELARCLMGEPELVLLDEPTAGVNPTLIRELMGTMRALNARGITLMIIEHNMNVIMELCAHVVVLDRGRPIAEGTPAEIQSDQKVLGAYLGGAA